MDCSARAFRQKMTRRFSPAENLCSAPVCRLPASRDQANLQSYALLAKCPRSRLTAKPRGLAVKRNGDSHRFVKLYYLVYSLNFNRYTGMRIEKKLSLRPPALPFTNMPYMLDCVGLYQIIKRVKISHSVLVNQPARF